jgi:SAM-dependent methyltransferase
MVSVLRYHEISEASHRIMNPLSHEKVMLLGEVCGLGPGTTMLDLACGKGEMLCVYAERFGTSGTGIDVYPPFLADAARRAGELGVTALVRFIEGDAAESGAVPGRFDVVSCIGATWIGGGLAGTLRIMSERLAPRGWMLVGEPFWADGTAEQVKQRHGPVETFTDLAGTLARIETARLDLVEMVLASADDWDRYAASQWLNVSRWLADNPGDPEAAAVRQLRDQSRREYLTTDRGVLGWGVFVLRRA